MIFRPLAVRAKVLDALHSRGIYLHPLREKPVRTEADEKARSDFADKYSKMPTSFWSEKIDAYLDNKYFPVYLTGRARTYAAKRVARGTFRERGGGLARGHVKPRKNLKMNFGAKSVLISAAISGAKVLMWHRIEGQWNAQAAERMYKNFLAPALRAAKPGKRQFLVLEDNDPSGYKSRRAVEAKAAEKLSVLELPCRSPDLNPLDYGFWSEVNRRMRLQERRFSAARRETEAQYVARLRRTATRLPKTYLTSLVQSMKRRCIALRDARGQDIEE